MAQKIQMNHLAVKYKKDFPKLTKSNSYIKDGVVFYIAKKNHNGNLATFYVAYEYKTKTKIAFHKDKDKLKQFLDKKIGEIKQWLK